MKLKPKIGFDNIKFGMTFKEVQKILKKPDRIIPDTDDDVFRAEWNNLKLRLTFSEDENDRLTYFVTKNNELIYNNNKIIGVDINNIKDNVFGDLIKKWEIDNYELFSVHFDQKNWISIHSEFDIIDKIEMGVPFKNDNEYKWPQ